VTGWRTNQPMMAPAPIFVWSKWVRLGWEGFLLLSSFTCVSLHGKGQTFSFYFPVELASPVCTVPLIGFPKSRVNLLSKKINYLCAMKWGCENMVALYAQCYPVNARLYLRIRGSYARQQFRNSKHVIFRRHIKSTRNKIHSFMFSFCKSTH
jgi:hypothetical protein